MAALLLGQGARRIGGSLLHRTQAAASSPAVAEEQRRLLVPRRMYSTQQQAEAMQIIQKQKEELYEALCKADLSMVEKWRNKRLLRNLAVHVNPRKHDIQSAQQAEAMQIQKQKEELYDALSKADKLRNRSLLQDLAAHVKPRAHDDEWRWLRASRRVNNFITTTGTAGIVLFVVSVAVVYQRYCAAIKEGRRIAEERRAVKTLTANQGLLS